MMVRTQRSGEWAALAIVLLALGVDAANLARGDSVLLTQLARLLNQPTEASMMFFAVGMLTLWLRQRIASFLCMAFALLLASLAVAGTPIDLSALSRSVPETMPVTLSLLLSIGALIHRIPLPRWTFALSATFCLTAATLSIVVLIAVALGSQSLSEASLSTARALGCLALSLVWLDYLFRGTGVPFGDGLTSLTVPVAFSGLVAAAVVCGLAASPGELSQGNQISLTVVTGAVSLWLTASVVAGVAVAGEALKLRKTHLNLKRILRRQRRIMHERAADLRSSRAQHKELFLGVPAPVMLTQPSGEVIAANPALLDLLGLDSEQQLKSMNVSDFYANPEDRVKLLEEWRRADGDTHQGELEMRRLDGEHRNVLYALRTVREPDRTIAYIQGAITDITDLRRSEASRRTLETTLRLSQKLESVGRLAAGIAHEINTPMQYIGDNLYFLKESFETLSDLLAQQKRLLAEAAGRSSAEILDGLAEIETRLEVEDTMSAAPGALERAQEGVRSVSHIVSAMKELAHPGQGSKASTSINDLVDTALAVTRNAYKTVAEVKTVFGDLPNILAYKNELCQVLINLIVNAAHAIETAKESKNVHGVIEIHTGLENDYVRIRVTDNGCGIPESVIDKIFDPFFTTKGVGQGTGQGLAIARTTVIDKHRGEIRVESTVGSGTTFTIELPTKESAPDSDSATKETAQWPISR